MSEAQEVYELPKSLTVGNRFKTNLSATKQPYDIQLIAIVRVHADGSISRPAHTLTQEAETDATYREVIVWENFDALSGLPNEVITTVHSDYAEEFIKMLQEIRPVLYVEPDIEHLVHEAVYTNGISSRSYDQRAVFLSSEAWGLMEKEWGRKSNRTNVGCLGMARCYTYDNVRLYEVPGIDGVKVWGGASIE